MALWSIQVLSGIQEPPDLLQHPALRSRASLLDLLLRDPYGGHQGAMEGTNHRSQWIPTDPDGSQCILIDPIYPDGSQEIPMYLMDSDRSKGS